MSPSTSSPRFTFTNPPFHSSHPSHSTINPPPRSPHALSPHDPSSPTSPRLGTTPVPINNPSSSAASGGTTPRDLLHLPLPPPGPNLGGGAGHGVGHGERHLSLPGPMAMGMGSVGGAGGSMSRSFREREREVMTEEMKNRDRQRQQDIDSAMSMSRARSNSIASPEDPFPPSLGKRHSLSQHQHRDSHSHPHSGHRDSHSHSHPTQHRNSQSHRYPKPSPMALNIEESPFPVLSEAEEAEMEQARLGSYDDDDMVDSGMRIGLEERLRARGGYAGSDGGEEEGEDEEGERGERDDVVGMGMGMGRRHSNEGSEMDEDEGRIRSGQIRRDERDEDNRLERHDSRSRSPRDHGDDRHSSGRRSRSRTPSPSPERRRDHDADSIGETRREMNMRGGGMRGSLMNHMMGGMGNARNIFDFSSMEEYAEKERRTLLENVRGGRWGELDSGLGEGGYSTGLGETIISPDHVIGPGGTAKEETNLMDVRDSEDLGHRRESGHDIAGGDAHGSMPASVQSNGRLIGGTGTTVDGDDGRSALGTSPPNNGNSASQTNTETTFVRRRQRKLSASNPVAHARRQGRLALFEGFGNGMDGNPRDGTFSVTMPDDNETKGFSSVLPTKAARLGNKNIYAQAAAAAKPTGYTDYPEGNGYVGAERPYRFSFYSNALPATIHARSLSELPSDGQTFDDLFAGRGGLTGKDAGPRPSDSEPGTFRSGASTPLNGGDMNGTLPNPKMSLLAKAAKGSGNSPPVPSKSESDDPEANTWWLDVLSPTDEEMRMLAKVFGIHPLTTEDILLEETREKIELFRNYYLVCFRSFDQDPYSQTYLEPLNMYIIVFREGTLSFHFRGTPHPQNVRRRIKSLKDYISVTSDWISYALIDDITDAFGPLIQSIEYEVDGIDELVLILKDAEQSDMLRRIGTCRKKVMGLLRLMGNKADVVKGLAKRCNENWSVAPKSDIGLYLSDIQDHLITMTQNLNHYEKILSRSHSNYLAQISIEMTDANNQINDVLSKLTALGTVLIPMNLVTGLWGMNVHVPGQDIESGYAWFGGILGGLTLFAVVGAWVTLRIFVRN